MHLLASLGLYTDRNDRFSASVNVLWNLFLKKKRSYSASFVYLQISGQSENFMVSRLRYVWTDENGGFRIRWNYILIVLHTLCKGCYRTSKVFVFSWTGKNVSNTLWGSTFSWTQRKNLSLQKYPDTRRDCLLIKSSQDICSMGCLLFVFLWHRKCFFYFLESIFPLQHTWICLRE